MHRELIHGENARTIAGYEPFRGLTILGHARNQGYTEMYVDIVPDTHKKRKEKKAT